MQLGGGYWSVVLADSPRADEDRAEWPLDGFKFNIAGTARHLRSVVASALGWTPPPGQPGWTVGMDGWMDGWKRARSGLETLWHCLLLTRRRYSAMLIQTLHGEALKAYLHAA